MEANETFILKDGTSLDPFLVKILRNRGLTEKNEIEKFLEPQLQDLPSPFLMKDMDKAVEILCDGIMSGDSILVWGDYDVDGVTSTALLLLFFRSIGCVIDYYIPNRLTEGYGLQTEGLKKLTKKKERRPDLLITVDNGISAHDAVDTARDLGYKVIITDHHTPPKSRVNAHAVLNPQQKSCSFPGKNLAGVGVAFYLAMGVRSYLKRTNYFSKENPVPNLKQFLDLVSIGTVADMVELDHINRILVRAGMETVGQGSNIGIASLCKQSNIDCKIMRSEDIAFQIAPKINAAGRLGAAENGVDLLVSRSKSKAQFFTAALIRKNEERKNITLDDFANAKDYLLSKQITQNCATIVAGAYHIGVAGIVASNLVEEFGKPALVLCNQGDNILKGSARSVKGVNLYEALSDCKEVLLGFGGHVMAAGMSLKEENLENFKELFENAVCLQSKGRSVKSEILAEEDIAVTNLFRNKILKQLLLLEPHGIGNPQPIFRDTSARFDEIIPVGKDKSHIRFSIINGTTTIKGIGFGLGKFVKLFRTNQSKSILYSPSLNFYKGNRNWQARVMSIVSNPTE